jgi:hypothetical protein
VERAAGSESDTGEDEHEADDGLRWYRAGFASAAAISS